MSKKDIIMKRFSAVLAALLCFSPLAANAQGPHSYGLDVRDMDIADAARLLGDATGYSIVLDGAVPRMKITLRYSTADADSAIRIFAQTEGLVVTKTDRTLILVRAGDISTRNASAFATKTFVVRNADVNALAAALKSAVPNASISADPGDRLLLARGTPGDLDVIGESVAKFDNAPSTNGVHVVTVPTLGKPSDIVKSVSLPLNPSGTESLLPNDDNNTITLTGGDGFIARASQVITSFDKYGAQVEYDVRIAEYTPRNDSKKLGLLFGGVDLSNTQNAGTYETATTFLTTSLKVNATLDAMLSHDEATVIADPNITTQNNVAGTLDATEQYPIVTSTTSSGVVSQSVVYQPIGVRIVATPTIGADGSITTAIDASYSGILSFVGTYPVIGNRHATTKTRVRNGETIVIAGLVQSNSEHNVQALPYLSQIPLVGNFFKHAADTNTKSELLFFITPHIVGDSAMKFAPKSHGAEAAAAAQLQPGMNK
jgi:type II secretory pathway component GspD/PulD (secretin)